MTSVEGGLPPASPWLDSSAGRLRPWGEAPLFKRGHSLRQMTVTLSTEVQAKAAEDAVDLMLGLLQSEHVRVLRYADEGPPPSALVESNRGKQIAEGWITFTPIDSPFVAGTATAAYEGSVTSTGAGISDILRLVERGMYTHAYPSDEQGRSQARADLIAEFAAEAAGTDLFVTRRPGVIGRHFSHASRGMTCVSPEAALPLVSLYLRTQGEYTIWRSPTGHGVVHTSRETYFKIAVFELLPSLVGWVTACGSSAPLIDVQGQSWLPLTVIRRLTRALHARDRIHAALLQPVDPSAQEDAAAELDILLSSLMAVFDVAARVAHLMAGLAIDRAHIAAWQKDDWRKSLAVSAPELAKVMTKASTGGDQLEILRQLRNSLHGEAPMALTVASKRQDPAPETWVGVRGREGQLLTDALARQGGAAAWGFRSMGSRSQAGTVDLACNVRVFVETLIPSMLSLLDQLLGLMPGVSGVTPDAGFDPRPDQFDSESGPKIRAQLGL